MKKALLAGLFTALPSLALADSSSAPGSATAQLLKSLFMGCWACDAFNTIGAIGLSFADTIFSQLATGMTILIGLFMALWILWFAAKLFLPFGAPGASHWNLGAAKLFKLAIVLAFLQTSGPFWDYIFIPILSTGLGIASQMATATDVFETNYGTSNDAPAGATDYCKGPLPAPNANIPLSDSARAAFTALQQMDCPLSRMQSVFGKGILIGVSVLDLSGCNKGWTANFLPQVSTLVFLATGLILILVFMWGFLVFPFLLIDVLTRVVLVAATSPLAIAATLFKPTARIAERSVWALLQCGLTLMFGAAVAGIGKALIAFTFAQMSPQSGGPVLTDWSNLGQAVENACTNGFRIDLTTASFYMLVGTAIISIYMMRKASALATELTGVAGSTGAQAGVAAIAGAAAGAAGRTAQSAYKAYRGNSNKSRQVTGNDWTNSHRDDNNKAGKVSGTEQD